VTLLAELRVGGPIEPWQSIGIAVHDDYAVVGGVRLRFVGGDAGLHGWGLAECDPTPSAIDGVATWRADLGGVDHGGTLQVLGTDHVVVNTSSLDRTCAAVEAATGAPLKRIREAGPIRQGFHRWGPVVVEVVESSQVTASTASLWGVVFTVANLHEVADQFGPEVLSAPRSAVQPGRFIASFRGSVGLGVPLALMSPDPRRG
jgi:hypothetical protein